MGRVLGVDLGMRRVGLAVSDPTGTLAGPHAVLERSGDADADRRAIVAVAGEVGAERIVVGLPRSLSGRDGPAAVAARAEPAARRPPLWRAASSRASRRSRRVPAPSLGRAAPDGIASLW